MELTEKDRLILFNQYEILKHLDSEETENYEIMQDIVVNGYKYNYNELLEGFGEVVDEEVSKFVFDVFCMYRALNNSYIGLNKEEREEINLKDITFQGFDGNEEGEFYFYACFVIEKMKRFAEFPKMKAFELNSHCNMVSEYKQMLNKWKEVRIGKYKDLSLSQIKNIISEGY